MVPFGCLTHIEATSGNEGKIERLLQDAQARVLVEPGTTAWFAFRLRPSTFGVFGAFPDEPSRQAYLSEVGSPEQCWASELLVQPRFTQQVDILAAKLAKPGGDNRVTVGFLNRYEAQPGKEAEIEHDLKAALSAIQEEPGTMAWFALRLGPSTFGVFDAFPDEAGRQAHFNARIAQLRERASSQFVEGSLMMEQVDILAAKLPSLFVEGSLMMEKVDSLAARLPG
jgi:quinol monooxygenase YgiN